MFKPGPVGSHTVQQCADSPDHLCISWSYNGLKLHFCPLSRINELATRSDPVKPVSTVLTTLLVLQSAKMYLAECGSHHWPSVQAGEIWAMHSWWIHSCWGRLDEHHAKGTHSFTTVRSAQGLLLSFRQLRGSDPSGETNPPFSGGTGDKQQHPEDCEDLRSCNSLTWGRLEGYAICWKSETQKLSRELHQLQ